MTEVAARSRKRGHRKGSLFYPHALTAKSKLHCHYMVSARDSELIEILRRQRHDPVSFVYRFEEHYTPEQADKLISLNGPEFLVIEVQQRTQRRLSYVGFCD